MQGHKGRVMAMTRATKMTTTSTARMATSLTMMTNTPAAAKRQKKHNNQPKTRGLNGGEMRYEAQPAGGVVGARVDCFRAIELG